VKSVGLILSPLIFSCNEEILAGFPSARNKVFWDIELEMMLENKNNNKMPVKSVARELESR
jgi:hypothetical protein